MNRHPYILATFAATLLSIVVWLCVPKEYTALTKLSDEYKETDLAVGFNALRAYLRDAMGNSDTGLNDMEIYCKVLKTDDFARSISHKKVPGKGITYGEYLCEEDTIEAIKDNINYNYSGKQSTLSVSFTDRDPVVAAQMLDSATAQLQQVITSYRQENARIALRNAVLNVNATKEKYKAAQNRYNAFADSHSNMSTPSTKQEEEELSNESKSAYALYQKAAEEYARQQALKQRAYLSFAVIQNNSVPQKADSYLIGYLLSFVLLALFITYAIQHRKNVDLKTVSLRQLTNYFSPWTLTIGIWAIILGLYYLLDTDLYPITSQFYFCFIIWIPIFCICAISTYMLSERQEKHDAQNNSINYNKLTFNFFFIVSLIITPLYVYRVVQIVIMFGTEDLMTNIRTLALFGDGQGILNYSAVINQALFVVALWAHPKVPTWQVVLLGIACLMNSLAIMEKGTMFFVFVSSVFVLFEKKVIRIRSILIFSAILFVVFYLFNLGRAGEDSDYQKEETILDFFIMYVLSPPVAFCQLPQEVTPQFGTNTFETVYLFLQRLGADVVVKDKLQEFVFVPVSTNVYTIFQPFYIDFSYPGIAFFAGIYGCVCGWLYRLYKNGNGVGTCLYTYAVYVLLLQFYQENVFYSLVFILQFAFFVVLFTQKKLKLSS